jgi:Glycosyltransferase family 87
MLKKRIHQLLNNTLWINAIWYVVPLLAAFGKAIHGANNYLIYKGVYAHTLQKTNLFDFYPNEYVDKNHYGIVFSLLIAPFTLLPNWLAILAYQAAQLFGLNYVIRKLPISEFKHNVILLFLLFEAVANCQNVQFNTFIAFVMVGAYIWIHNQNEFKAAFIIALGFFVKLYGIVGLGLFFFVKNKVRFILYLALSTTILYLLPLLITDFNFLNQSYIDWFVELKSKNGTNSDLDNIHQNMSAVGLFMKITHNSAFNVLYIVIPAFILQLIPIIRWQLHQNKVFQMLYLASLLMFIILFNTATEASTHIIGATGVGIWWMNQRDFKSRNMLIFMAFVFFLGTLSTTDLVPRYFNFDIVRKYSLKALPYLIVWFMCMYQLVLGKFTTEGDFKFQTSNFKVQ